MASKAAVAIGVLAIGGVAALLASSSSAAETRPQPKPQPKPKPEPGTGGNEQPPAPAPKPAPKTDGPPVATETKFPAAIPGHVPPVTIKPDDLGHMANELMLNLITLQLATGGPKTAQGRENKTLVRTFQKQAGLSDVDGYSGPATFLAAARRLTVGTVPLVMYWPKKADRKTVLAYRTALRAIAGQAPEPLRTALKVAANKERGQSAANGPLVPEGVDVVNGDATT